MAVATLSVLVGPIPRLPIATSPTGWRLTLWAMYIVNSTSGRKTTTIETGLDIIEQALGRDSIIPWEGSPQGLIQRLQARDNQAAVFARDEYSGLLKQINRGGHLAGLEQTFIRAYDGHRIENIRTRKRDRNGAVHDDTDRVECPYLVKLTAATRDSFTMAATIDNVLNGFLARFIFVTGNAEPRPLRLSSGKLVAVRQQLIEHAKAFHARANATPTLLLMKEVLDAHWSLEQAWARQAVLTCCPEAAGPTLKRLAPPLVMLSHFEAARQMADRWRSSTLQVLEDLGRSEFSRNCERVLATVRAHPAGVSMSAMYRAHRNLRQRDFDDVLKALQTQERIVHIRSAAALGRPSNIFRAAPSTRRDSTCEETTRAEDRKH
jgi:hypothetical protein